MPTKGKFIEFRLQFDPLCSSELLLEMAEELKDKLYNDLCETTRDQYYPVPMQVTYEVITEWISKDDVCKCDGLTVSVNGEAICSKCGKVQVN
jgi:hypothetical protein